MTCPARKIYKRPARQTFGVGAIARDWTGRVGFQSLFVKDLPCVRGLGCC